MITLLASLALLTPAAHNTVTAQAAPSYQTATVSFYDEPQELACGGYLTSKKQGVAHKSLPCGTKVQFKYKGRTATVKVIDRGPYVEGREFDLTGATAKKLGLTKAQGVDTMQYRVIK